MRRLLPLLAVLGFTLGVLACEDRGDTPGGGDLVPAATAADLNLAAQQADSFDVMATWQPVVFLNDTVRSYIRDVDRQDGTWAEHDTIGAVGSEIKTIPSPPAGSTAVFNYCLRSRATNEVGDTVATADSLAACTSFQYTAPTSTPPPPDSLEVSPNQTLTLDSLDVYPDSARLAVGDSIQLTAVLYKDGSVVGCAGACDTVYVTPWTWEGDLPVVAQQRYDLPQYFGEEARAAYDGHIEWMPVRLPWLRQIRQYRGSV